MSAPTSPPPAIAFTIALGDGAREEARLCVASFRHWHPEIPFLIIDEKLYDLLGGGQAPASLGEIMAMRALAGWFLARHAARLIYVDADLFILGRLDGLLDPGAGTLWTADWSVFTMGVPEAPRVNSGVLATSDPAFWQAWTAAQFGYLVPAQERVYFDQITLRLLIMAGAVKGRVIDGHPGAPYYNVSIGEQPGEWRVDNNAVYKGAERALVYHLAGQKVRGIAGTPPALHPFLEQITSGPPIGSPNADLTAWWAADGAAFTTTALEQFTQWPIGTLENVVPEVYAATPGYYRTVAPLLYDRQRKIEGTGWERMFKREWQAYIYYKAKAEQSPGI